MGKLVSQKKGALKIDCVTEFWASLHLPHSSWKSTTCTHAAISRKTRASQKYFKSLTTTASVQKSRRIGTGR